ncbi:MAG: outer membrane beta-barrel protein [Candidatus Symbiothrix sp.]|jgi:hypothetical protein|nr:outer membrane beta-barrel protein [Candidatus Symbiothrix sp.]
MKIVGNALIFLLLSFSAFGQKNITLSGTILDKVDNEPIVAGSVELLTAKDSTFVAGAISSAAGFFSFKNEPAGKYILKITYLGYNQLTKNVTLKADNPSMDLGKLYLETNDILLKEAVIEGKKPEVIVKNDTIEYDAGSFKVTENAVIEDLLKKMPGVEVDKDGKITVNGKEVKKFLVDSKEFFSDDPQVASKNLPAAMVDKVQVLDRKSDMARMTGFDDGEEETIINLTIREGMKKGTMGNALVGAGSDLEDDHDVRYQAAAFLNHMKDSDRLTVIVGTNNNNNMGAADLGANQFGGMRMRRGGGGGVAETTNFMASLNKEFSQVLSLNSDVRYNGSDRLSISDVTQTSLFGTRNQLDKTLTNTDYFSDNISANVTLDWHPNAKHNLIFRPNIRYNRSHSDETEHLDRYNYTENSRDTTLMFKSNSDTWNKGDGINWGATLDYAYNFDKAGRVFSINARGSLNDNYSQEDSRNYYYEKQEDSRLPDEQNQRLENDNNTGNYQATVSYVEPIGNNNFLQALYRISYYDTKSINSTYDIMDEFATLSDSLSKSVIRHSTEQRFGLSFKAVRPKYNYTVGFNVDPTHSTNKTYQPDKNDILPIPYPPVEWPKNEIGKIQTDTILQDVVNFSPVINFNYIFGQRTNLRINYEGETVQPSANQLSIDDQSRPTEWIHGNRYLKPGYTNSLRTRYSKYVAATQLMYNLDLNGNLSINDIVSVSRLREDGIRETTYENVNGNWDMRLRGMFNMPLRNKRFTIGSFANISYRNQNSFVDADKNTLHNFSIMDNTNINYRSDLFDVGLNASINYNNITYTIDPEKNQSTYNFGVGAYTTWYLPHNLTIDSDINATNRHGYYVGLDIPEEKKKENEVIWNIAVTKQLFNKKFGTGSLKLQIFDILQDRNNITASATNNGYRISEVNVIPSYFMCSFIYKFTVFPKSSSATEEDLTGGNRFGPGGPRPGGGRLRF